MCPRGKHLVVVEIKRPKSKASIGALEQIEEYVNFVRNEIDKTPSQYDTATGYLLCGDLVDNYRVRGKRNNLEKAQIYIKRYGDLLKMVQKLHTEIDRYNELQKAKQRTENNSQS